MQETSEPAEVLAFGRIGLFLCQFLGDEGIILLLALLWVISTKCRGKRGGMSQTSLGEARVKLHHDRHVAFVVTMWWAMCPPDVSSRASLPAAPATPIPGVLPANSTILFAVAALTNYHKHSGLARLFSELFWSSEVQNGSYRDDIKVSAGLRSF